MTFSPLATPTRFVSLCLVYAMAACGVSGDSGAGYGSDSGPGGGTSGGEGGVSAGGDSGGATTGTGGTAGTSGGSGAGDTGGGSDTGMAGSSGGDSGTTGGLQCDTQTPVTLFLSPDDSNSISSPVQVREAVLGNGGWGLYGVAIRPWEFFNYYSFAYPPAPASELAVTTEMVHREGDPDGQYVLQIAVTSEQVTNATREPMSLTFVLDTSGSMGGQPMEMLKETCRAIASKLVPGDTVSLVTWNTENLVLLAGHEVTSANDPLLLDEIDQLSASGGTDLHGGLEAGYGLAQQVYAPDRINRVILVSDGGANVGIVDKDLIAMHAGANGADGIYLVGVGVGTPGSYNDELMDTVTDVGKGASVFVPTKDDAWNIFATHFIDTLSVAARDVQVQLDMPPGFEIVKFSGEEFGTDPTEIEPQHLAPNDSMVFHQTIATCDADSVTDETALSVTVRWKDADTLEAKEVSVTRSFGQLLGGESARLAKGAALVSYGRALQARRDTADASGAISEAKAAVQAAQGLLPGDLELAEIAAVLAAL